MRLYSTPRGIARELTPEVLAVLDLPVSDVRQLLTRGGIEAARTARVSLEIPFESSIVDPLMSRVGKVVSLGLNFPSHGSEALAKYAEIGKFDVVLPTIPNVQISAGSAISSHNAPIQLPPVAAEFVDYEGELGVIIGSRASHITPASAWHHVAGVTVVNDVTARDIQRRAYSGDPVASIGVAKSFDTFKPLGPALVTVDELGSELLDLEITTRVNGELRQQDSTRNFIHPIPELLAYISRFVTLEPGDLVCTGSPSGAGQFTERFLRAGDTVEVSIAGIGILNNPVCAA